MSAAADDGSDARNDVRRGFVWLGSASLAARLIEIVKVTIVLCVLSPEQLGQATLAWSVSVVLEAVSGLGIGSALLQASALCERTLASAFWYTQAVASLMVVAVWALAPWLSQLYGHPELAPMLMVAVTKLWFVGFSLLPLMLLNRALAYERIACVSTLSSLTSGLTTCTLACLGVGAWAPLLGNLSGGLAGAIYASLLQPYRPRWFFRWRYLAPHARFGIKVAAAGVVQQLVRNLDYLLVGRWLDLAAVGVYRVAFDLAMAPCLAITQVTTRASVRVYASLRDQPEALVRTFSWTLESLGFALAPLCFAVAVHGELLLGLVKAGAWREASALLPWLCTAAFLRGLSVAFPPLFQALYRPTLALLESLLSGAVLCACLALALHGFAHTQGARAAAFGWLGAGPVVLLSLVAITRRLLPVRVRELVRSQRHALGALIAMALAGFVARQVCQAIPPAAATPAVVSLELLAYLLYARHIAGARWARIRRPAAASRLAPIST